MKFSDLIIAIEKFNAESKKHFLMAWETSSAIIIETFNLNDGKVMCRNRFYSIQRAIAEIRSMDNGLIPIDSLWRLT